MTDFLSVRPLWRGRAPLSSLRTFTNSIHLTLIAASDFTLRRILRSRLVNSVSDDINRQVRIGTLRAAASFTRVFWPLRFLYGGCLRAGFSFSDAACGNRSRSYIVFILKINAWHGKTMFGERISGVGRVSIRRRYTLKACGDYYC